GPWRARWPARARRTHSPEIDAALAAGGADTHRRGPPRLHPTTVVRHLRPVGADGFVGPGDRTASAAWKARPTAGGARRVRAGLAALAARRERDGPVPPAGPPLRLHRGRRDRAHRSCRDGLEL